MEKNKLIAEFMGATFDVRKHQVFDGSYPVFPSKYTKHEYTKFGDYPSVLVSHLSYHDSWDWLMPSIKKAIDQFGTDACNELILSLKYIDISLSYAELVKVISNGIGK